jgi:CO/xanthine dehydrogenase FAD-binding subunit
VKPAPFELLRPKKLPDATAMLAYSGEDTVILAGGQSLIPLMNMRLVAAERLLDLNEVPELDYVEERSGCLVMGAMTRQREVETSPVVLQRCPILAHAERFVGHVGIRKRGTVGGSVAHADPVAELTCLAVTLEATVVLRSQRGARELDATEFILGTFSNSREPDEILTEIKWPFPGESAIWGFSEFAPRAGDFPYVTAAVVADYEGGRCRHVRLGVGGLGPVPVRLSECEQSLEGAELTNEAAATVGALAGSLVELSTGQRLPESYMRDLASAVVTRTLRQAMSRSSDTGRTDG